MVGRRMRPGKRTAVRFAEPQLKKDDSVWKELDELVPQDHIARTFLRGLELLDLQPLYDSYSASGSAPYRPELMLIIVLIERHQGHRSPSQWHRNARDSAVLKWAGLGIQPARSVWYEFRDRLSPSLVDEWNRQILHAARELEMTTAERGALDGSSVEANASRHRLVNQERLEKRQAQLEAALASDAQDQPPDEVPGWMAKTPETREIQRERYQRAEDRLGQLLEANEKRIPSERRPVEKVVVSPTDPDAALGLDKFKIFRPLYNIQLVRDLDSPLVLGYETFPQSTDAGTLQPMLTRTAVLTGVPLRESVVDAGYVTGVELAACEAADVTLYGPWKENDFSAKRSSKSVKFFDKDQFEWMPAQETYRCPAGHQMTYQGSEARQRSAGRAERYHRYRCPPEHCKACPLQAQCTKSPQSGRSLRRSEHEEVVQRHRARMETEAAKAIYRLRSQTVELGFADFKEHRRLRRFTGRALPKVRGEMGLTVLAYNLRYVAVAASPDEDSP